MATDTGKRQFLKYGATVAGTLVVVGFGYFLGSSRRDSEAVQPPAISPTQNIAQDTIGEVQYGLEGLKTQNGTARIILPLVRKSDINPNASTPEERLGWHKADHLRLDYFSKLRIVNEYGVKEPLTIDGRIVDSSPKAESQFALRYRLEGHGIDFKTFRKRDILWASGNPLTKVIIHLDKNTPIEYIDENGGHLI